MWNLFFGSWASAASFTDSTCAINNGKLVLSSQYDLTHLPLLTASVYNVQALSLSYLYDHITSMGLKPEDREHLVELLLLVAVFQDCWKEMPYIFSLSGLVLELKANLPFTLARYATLKAQSDGELNGHVLTASLLWSTDLGLPPCPLLISSSCYIAPCLTQAIVMREPQLDVPNLDVPDASESLPSISLDNIVAEMENEVDQEESGPGKKDEYARQHKNGKKFTFNLSFSKLSLGYSYPLKLFNVSGCMIYNGSLHLSENFDVKDGRVHPKHPHLRDPRFYALSFLYGQFNVSILSDQEKKSLTEWALIVAVYQRAFYHTNSKGRALSTICRIFYPLKNLIYGRADSTELKQMVAAYERMRADSPAGMVHLFNEALRLWKTDPGLPLCQSLNGLSIQPVNIVPPKKLNPPRKKTAKSEASLQVAVVLNRDGSILPADSSTQRF